jgi:hypothetical protein
MRDEQRPSLDGLQVSEPFGPQRQQTERVEGLERRALGALLRHSAQLGASREQMLRAPGRRQQRIEPHDADAALLNSRRQRRAAE